MIFIQGNPAKEFIVAAFMAIFWVSSVSPSLAGVQEGIEAYESGDYDVARKYFEESAVESESQFYLGLLHETGNGAVKNYSMALGWYQRAAGANNVEAQIKLANMYENGLGAPRNIEKAGKWYARAAKNGDVVSQARYGLMLLNGYGMPRDIYAAANWFRRAAEGGHTESQSRLDKLQRQGLIISDENLTTPETKDIEQPKTMPGKGAATGNGLEGIFRVA